LHYSLKPGGLLLLGTSENIGRSADRFTLLDKKWKIYQRLADHGTMTQPMELPKAKSIDRLPEENIAMAVRASRDAGTVKLLKAILAQSYLPVCVVVDDKAELIYARAKNGEASRTGGRQA
jgi:two-component system CheB/CheR fusion protein